MLQDGDLLPCPRVPQLHILPPIARGDALAVGAETHAALAAPDGPEGGNLLARLHVPYALVFFICRDDGLAIGAEGHVRDCELVSFQSPCYLSGLRIPYLHRCVRKGTARGEALAVGAEAHAEDRPSVPLEGE